MYCENEGRSMISLLCMNKGQRAYTWAEQEGQKRMLQLTNQLEEAQEHLELVNVQPETIALWFSTQNEFDSGCNNWQGWSQNSFAEINWPGMTDTTWEFSLMFYRNMRLDKEGNYSGVIHNYSGVIQSYSGFTSWSKKENSQLPGYSNREHFNISSNREVLIIERHKINTFYFVNFKTLWGNQIKFLK